MPATRIGSLFSGGGGLDLAVEQVFGGHTAWHCEVDKAASKVLAHRWPGVPNHHDITAVDWAQVEPVDVLCGGWPCQPFSLAGKRKGADDERALWPYVARAVRMVRPRIVVLENVSAVLGPEFQRVANDLAALGYDIAWTCLRASDVGAPHRRERVFIVATDTERRDSLQSHGHPAFGRRSRDSEQAWMGDSGAVGGRGGGNDQSQGAESSSGPPLCAGSGDHLLPTPAAQRSGRNQSPSPGAAIRPSLDSITELLPTPTAVEDANGARNATSSRTDSESKHHSGTTLNDIAFAGQWGKYATAIRRWESVTRSAPAPTEPNKNGNPRLSAAFSQWLMGWPAGWVTDIGISRNDALRIIGNGVVPQQAQAAIRWLLSVSEAVA